MGDVGRGAVPLGCTAHRPTLAPAAAAMAELSLRWFESAAARWSRGREPMATGALHGGSSLRDSRDTVCGDSWDTVLHDHCERSLPLPHRQESEGPAVSPCLGVFLFSGENGLQTWGIMADASCVALEPGATRRVKFVVNDSN